MAELQGTIVVASIVPSSTEDNYATHDAIYGKGGWREVATIEERNNISRERLREGMVVYVSKTKTDYKLMILGESKDGDVWEEFFTGVNQKVGDVKVDNVSVVENGVASIDLATPINEALNSLKIGLPNGVATLDSSGKVPQNQLPSYVDDVLEYESKSLFPTTGEGGKIYVDASTNKSYRWSGTKYIEISNSLAIGTINGTAADGGVAQSHYNDNTRHITATERTEWNAKQNSNETIDYSQSAEPTLNTSKEDTLKGHLSYFAKAVKWIKGQFSKYLPLAGGTMSGAIDMNKNPLKNAGFEVVTALPTTNLFVGRKVIMNGIEYTYNGNLWTSQLDPLQKYANNTVGINTPLTTLNAKTYEIQLDNSVISQIPQLLTNDSTSLTAHVLQSNEYIYERMDNGTTEWVETSNHNLYLGDKLRFTAWKDWKTNVRGLSSKRPSNINYILISINKRDYKMKITIEYLTYTNTLGDADVNNSANYTWWKVYEKEFPEQKTTWIFPLQKTLYEDSVEGGTDGRFYIHNVRITIESITAGSSPYDKFVPYISIYTSKQINPQNVPININYDAKIKPTQTTTTYKTLTWILQYLIQAINWLRDNLLTSGANATLGNVTATKFVKSDGTSSQFLKADGSVDSNSYATLNEEGQLERAILADDLGGREETREEQFTFQPTANDESVKDGLAVVKSIKGNTVVSNLLPVINPGLPNFERKYTLIQEGNLIKFVFDKISEIAVGPRLYMPFQGVTRTKGTFYAKIDFAGTHGIQSNTLNGSFVYSSRGYRINFSPLINNASSISFLWNFSDSTSFFIAADSTENGLIVEVNAELCVRLTVIDLTQMFGAGNEPATVEEFERLYPNLPTEYNEGSLLNLNADSIKSVGFNAFNGEYAQVLGGMQYYLGGNIISLTFKENLEDEGEVIEIPSDNLYTPATNGYLVATGSDICINLSHSGYRNGEYEPYKESIANLPIKDYFQDGMKSAGAIKDEIVWDESIKKYKAIQRVGIRAYQTGDENLTNVLTDKTNTIYELAEPIETIIENYDLIDYEVSDFGTEEILSNEPTTPIVADIQYGFNAVDEIRNHRFAINSLKRKVSDIDTIRTNANTAYSWGNHADVGYAKQTEVTEELNNLYNTLLDEIPTELPPTDNSVTTAKIADNSISTSKIQDKAIEGSKIGQEEITTIHIAKKAITNEKLDKNYIVINGTPISLGNIKQVSGLVTANGNSCFLEIANNELILSKPTFAENGSIANVEEIVRYPLLTELPTIPNPTANATEITDITNWFNANISNYIIPKDLMYEFLSGNILMSEMLFQLNGASCTLTSYNLDFKHQGVDMTTLISDLTTREGYEVYVENDIDSITTSGICTLKFKIDGTNVIIECYKKIV